MKAGLRLGCADCSTEVIVVRPPEGEVTLSCGGSALVDVDSPRHESGHPDAASDLAGVLLGKRYEDDVTGIELLCTKPGTGALACDGRPMGVKQAKPLPSSD
ncbi:MAG TPA: hypothetical protein VED63_04580 [Acidimicrobiales bacterium]|nr:hypothetical protein [Acidimicrobiales bacterium]